MMNDWQAMDDPKKACWCHSTGMGSGQAAMTARSGQIVREKRRRSARNGKNAHRKGFERRAG
jgi:hypothetical protein